jgi:hypothetical protein
VEYWEKWEAANATNPALQTIKAPKEKKVRKRRVYSLESLLRQKDKYGKPKWIDPVAEEEKRRKRALNDAAWQKVLDKEKRLAEQQALAAEASAATTGTSTKQLHSTWLVAPDGNIYRNPAIYDTILHPLAADELLAVS